MAFIMASGIMGWIGIILSWKALHSSGSFLSTRLMFAGLVLPPALVSIAYFRELVQVFEFLQGRPVAFDYDFLPMWLIGAAGIISLAVFGYRLFKQRFHSKQGFFSVGANVMGLLIALYLIFAVVDQFMFYGLNRDQAGTVNWDYFRSKVNDVQCDSDVLLVSNVSSDLVRYRCPGHLKMILGRFSGTPFVAWPGYTDGRSAQLANELHKLHSDAIKIVQ